MPGAVRGVVHARPGPVCGPDAGREPGAGDVLHGALTFALCRALGEDPGVGPLTGPAPGPGGCGSVAETFTEEAFAAALGFAIPIASAACASFGTRAWMRV
ncbi:hypothetical protein AB0M95_11190 [Sphaerisporangium sp. NPDC051017]|uniref:hypothetical protein n=1 Tax=Sphaerisporangium sp. NPDC051017 TaxID=3154636 RepID=UPI00341DD019